MAVRSSLVARAIRRRVLLPASRPHSTSTIILVPPPPLFSLSTSSSSSRLIKAASVYSCRSFARHISSQAEEHELEREKQPQPTKTIPPGVRLEEETLPTYDVMRFYPAAEVGKVLGDKYELVCKLGYGEHWTEWLAKDLDSIRQSGESKESSIEEYTFLKIFANDPASTAYAAHQWALADLISSATASTTASTSTPNTTSTSDSPSIAQETITDDSRPSETQAEPHPGLFLLRLPQARFTISTSLGAHTCLAYPPIGLQVQKLEEVLGEVPTGEWLKYLKTMIRWSLIALDSLHSVGGVHTDIHPTSLLTDLISPASLSNLATLERMNPSARKSARETPEHLGFKIFESREFVPKVEELGAPTLGGLEKTVWLDGAKVECDLAVARAGRRMREDENVDDAVEGVDPVLGDEWIIRSPSSGEDKWKGLIQRDVWRAPEVILGAGWDAKADVWGMGCVIWRLINRRPLFYGRLPGSSGYTHEGHVAEMVAVMGSPPKPFLNRAGEKESAEVFRPGTSILRSGLLPASCSLSSLIDLDLDAIDPEHGGEAGFLEFMGTMLRWDPEERLSAAEVAGLGWLDVE